MAEMFEQASRLKLRFPYKGQVSVEDLWDLEVETLDEIYQRINKDLKAVDNRDSLLQTKTQRRNKVIKAMELQIAILKHIAEAKLTEADIKEKKKIRAEQRTKVLGLIAEKQNEALRGKSIEELMALIGEEEQLDEE